MTDLFRKLLKSDAPDHVQDQVNLWLGMAEDAVRQDERKAIAAWLRKFNYQQIADAIEAEEHRK